jgi:hypothetical protein
MLPLRRDGHPAYRFFEHTYHGYYTVPKTPCVVSPWMTNYQLCLMTAVRNATLWHGIIIQAGLTATFGISEAKRVHVGGAVTGNAGIAWHDTVAGRFKQAE